MPATRARDSAGAVISVEGPEISASSVVWSLQRTAPPGTPHVELVNRARRGIEFLMAPPPLWGDDSSTRRELWGVLAFVMAAGSLFAGGHHRMVMENPCCVFTVARWAAAFHRSLRDG